MFLNQFKKNGCDILTVSLPVQKRTGGGGGKDNQSM